MGQSITYRDILLASPRDILAALEYRLPFLVDEADLYAEGCDLSGEGNGYADIQAEVSRLIGRLKRVHAEIGARRGHAHEWGDSDYCRICGADGRA